MAEGTGTIKETSLPTGPRLVDLPSSSRPRERLFAEGTRSLSVQELVALVIGAGVPGRSALDVATAILAKAGPSIASLGRLEAGDLMDLPGVGASRAARLVAAVELGRRVAAAPVQPDEPIRGPADVHRRVAATLAALGHEEFHVLLLNAQNVPQGIHRVTKGILDASLIHPREVFRHAILARAAAVILLHNHPSGDPTPSREDWAVTQQLSEAGTTVGIPVLDHIIIAGNRYRSLMDQNGTKVSTGSWHLRDQVPLARHDSPSVVSAKSA